LRRSFIAAVSLWVLILQAGPALAEVEGELASRTRSYLHTWSTNTRAALADVPRIYAPRVNFYGRILDHGSAGEGPIRSALASPPLLPSR
jgi:hypothetical protein